MSKISSRVLLNFSQKRFLHTSTAASSSTFPLTSLFTLEFLKDSCGLSSSSASSIYWKLQANNDKNSHRHESLVALLKSYGFENTQIAKLIAKRPSILQCRLDSNLKPKFEFLGEIGFAGPLLPKVIMSNPAILFRGLDSRLKPSYFFVKEMLYTNDKVIAAIGRSSWFLTLDFKGTMQSNIDALLRVGVPHESVSKLIAWQPRAITQKVDRMVYAVKKVQELGIQPTAPMFVHAVRAILSMKDSNWKKKFDILGSFGWSEEEILAAFKRDPLCLTCSEKKMRDVLDFCFNTAKLDPKTVKSYPKFFMYGLDKRLRPRYKVVKLLMLNNLIKWDRKIAWLLIQGEKSFLKNYVLKNLKEVPNLMDIYRGKPCLLEGKLLPIDFGVDNFAIAHHDNNEDDNNSAPK